MFSLIGSSESLKAVEENLKRSAASTIQKAKEICSSKSVTITYIVQSIRTASYKAELIDSTLSLFSIWGQIRVHSKKKWKC